MGVINAHLLHVDRVSVGRLVGGKCFTGLLGDDGDVGWLCDIEPNPSVTDFGRTGRLPNVQLVRPRDLHLIGKRLRDVLLGHGQGVRTRDSADH